MSYYYCKERTTLTALLACWMAMVMWTTTTMTTTAAAAASQATMEIESVSSQRSIAAATSTSITATAGSAGAAADVGEGEGTVVGARAKMSNGAAGRVVAAAWQQQTDLVPLFDRINNNHKETAAAEDRGRSRHLQTTKFSFTGDLTQAARSTGIPSTTCASNANGYPSLFYKVTGGNGSNVTASTCDGPQDFFQIIYVWKGNGTCPSFICAIDSVLGCSAVSNGVFATWTAATGAEYYVQVLGSFGLTGTYTLTLTSDGPFEASEANVCQPPPTPPPTDVPSHVPSGAPTALPSGTPTDLPTSLPTEVPDPCAGVGTSYWLYNTTTNAPIRTLVNNSATCLLHPFNIEVRPCNTPGVSTPVRVRLVDTIVDTPTVLYKSKPQSKAPFLLFGPAPTIGDVLPSPKPLHNGNYYVAVKGAPEWGRLQFTQNCPCPDGTNKKPGKKGCMK